MVGVPSEQWGEEVAAYVVLTSGTASVEPAELEEHCREHLAGFKIPRRWHVVSELPRNASGKVVKRDLAPEPPRPVAP